jgi:hypothetical protein
MRYFSSTAKHTTITRKGRMNMSNVLSARIARQVGDILELTQLQITKVKELYLGTVFAADVEDNFTPAEFRCIFGLLDWWRFEESLADSDSYIITNANVGKSLVITATKLLTPRVSKRLI